MHKFSFLFPLVPSPHPLPQGERRKKPILSFPQYFERESSPFPFSFCNLLVGNAHPTSKLIFVPSPHPLPSAPPILKADKAEERDKTTSLQSVTLSPLNMKFNKPPLSTANGNMKSDIHTAALSPLSFTIMKKLARHGTKRA